MSNNKKISDLPQTNYISDDALIPIVQNRQNNVVTVKELSDKVGERHDTAIAQLWHELQKVGGGEFVPKTKNMLASLQWQLNELRKSNECKDKEQDSQLILLNKALRDTVSKTIIHGNELAQLNAEMKIANANITYLQADVNKAKEDTTYLKDAYTYLKDLVKVADGDNKGQISVGLDNIIDGTTIVKDGDKIKSGLKLVYDKKGSNVDNVTLDHPQMRLVDVNNKTFGAGVDVSDFIVDGLLQDVKYNEATHTIDFTWNTDTKTEEGKPVPKTASVDISKLFNIEQLHTSTPNYLKVNTVTSSEDRHPHEGDVKGGRCFAVDAVVDTHDYDTTFALTHTPASADGATVESYAKNTNDTGIDPSQENATVSNIKGLADAKKVANAVKYLAGQIVDLGNDRIAAEKKNADAIAKESSDARKAEKVNADAIAKLNSNENTDGSVAHSIKTAIDALDSEVTGVAAIDTSSDATKEATKLVSVKVTQTDGKLTDVAVEAKIASLVVPVNDDSKVDYKKDTISVAARGLIDSGDGAKDGIASLNPALVTLQDAWLYGQCIKAQAVKEIASDNNDYIHISRIDNQTKINFEPWVEVHTADEINAL